MKRVYFLRPVGHLTPVKIGCSLQPEKRLETHTIWSPLRLEIIATAPGGHDKESKLHGMFRKHHLHGEWFGASKELLALIDHVIATGELPELPSVLPFPTRMKKAKAATNRPKNTYPPLREGERAEADRLRAAYEGGTTLHDLADQEGRSVQRVRRLIVASGGTISRQGKRMPQGLDETNRQRIGTISARYAAGETLQAIAKDYGITRERVRQLLRKAGVPSAGWRPENRRHAHELTADEIEAARLYSEGTSPKDLSARFGLTGAQINVAVRRCGFKVQPAGYWLRRADDAERTALICRLYSEGVTAVQMSRQGIVKNPETIYRYLAKGGIRPRNEGRRGRLESVASAVIAAYHAGSTLAEVAATFGSSPATVKNLIKRHGASLPKLEIERRRVEAVRRANVARKSLPTLPSTRTGVRV